MYKFLLALALLFGVVSGSAQAAVGQRFVVGVESPHELAELVRASLAKDNTGSSVVSDESCRKYRACATPNDYVEMFLASDPTVNISVGNLAKYLDSLVVVDPPEGPYWMACKKGASAAAKPLWNCLARKFHTGEKAYADPLTGKIVLAHDCTNPVGKPDVEDECIYQHVYLKKGDTVHKFWMGPSAYPQGDCIPAVLKAGQTEWSTNLLDECPELCDGSKPLADLIKIRHWPVTARVWKDRTVSFVAEEEGWYIFRNRVEVISFESEDVLCKTSSTGVRSLSTYMPGVTYRKGHSYATYGISQPKDWNGVVHPWHMFPSGEIEQP